MKLRVLTPDRQVVDAEVSELSAPGVAGEFGVLPQHVTLLGGLDAGILSYVEGGAVKRLFIEGGYGEVKGDLVTVLADDAAFADDLDAGLVREELRRAQEALETGANEPGEVDVLLHALKIAQARASLFA